MTSLVNVTNDYIAGAHRFYTIGSGTSNDNLTNFSIQPKYETVRIQDSNVFITGSIYPTSCNVYDLGSSNYRWRDLYLSGNTIDLGGTRISRDNDTGGMKISSKVNDTPLDFTAQHITALGTLFASNIVVSGDSLIVGENGNVGMGTDFPSQKLDVRGNIYASGNIVCSNISVIGDFVRLDTITSNTEQIVVENAGTGPALKVTQSGANSVAEFYDSESGVALFVGNNGNIGIGTNNPRSKLDLVGNLNLTGNIYKNDINWIPDDITMNDTRSVNTNPFDLPVTLRADFKTNTTNGLNDGGTYNVVISMKHLSGIVNQLAFTENNNMWIRSGGNTTWNTWKRVLTNTIYEFAVWNLSSNGVGYLKYNTFLIDNSAMNKTTGLFTAPINGVYHFDFFGFFDGTGAAHQLRFYKNNSGYGGRSYSQYNYVPVSMSINVSLNINETFGVYLESGLMHNVEGNFSGYLIKPT